MGHFISLVLGVGGVSLCHDSHTMLRMICQKRDVAEECSKGCSGDLELECISNLIQKVDMVCGEGGIFPVALGR